MITAGIERLHPRSTHQAADNRKGSCEGGLRDPRWFGSSFCDRYPWTAGYSGNRGVHGMYAEGGGAHAVRSIHGLFFSDGSFYAATLLEVLGILLGVPRFSRFSDCLRDLKPFTLGSHQMLGLVGPATPSLPDGFHHCEFWLVRDIPRPAALSGQSFDLEHGACASSSSASTGA